MISIDKEYDIHYYDIDFNKKVMVTSILNFLQDIFVYTSEVAGRGIEYMNGIGLTWIVYKWEIDMYDYPKYNDKINIRMTPTAYRKSYMNIKFEIFNSDKDKIAEATSLWALIDIKGKTLCKDKFKDVYKVYGLSEKENKINVMKKICIPDGVSIAKEFGVEYCDIDTNGHVNNVRYLSWILDSISENVLKNYKIKTIKIAYKNSANYKDVIRLRIKEDKMNNLVIGSHTITDKNNVEIVRAETIWLEKSTKTL